MKKYFAYAASTLVALSLSAPAFANHNHHIGADVSVSAHAHSGSGSHAHSGSGSQVNLPCMQTAVEKRDNAIIAALGTYYTSWKTSLETRRDELKAAWGMTDKDARREAINAAWKKFRDSRHSQRKTFREARQNAWKTFRADAKACKVKHLEIEGQGADSQD